MGTICQQSKIESLEIINSFSEGLEKNMMAHPDQVPLRAYAMRVYGLPQLNELVARVLADEMERQKIQQQSYRGVELPPFLIHRRQIYYQGEWDGRTPHGKGKIYLQEGHYYEGYLNRGEADCTNGILIFCDGSYYRGAFDRSQLAGHGRMVSQASIYQGNWQNSKPHGQGRQTFSDGNEYEGEFVDGVKEGEGVFRWKDGKVYSGYFANGKMNGRGRLYLGDESYFEGQFKDNKKQGSGKLKTAYGIYSGPFQEGQFSGNGSFQWNDGKIYKGQFRDGNLDGEGVLTFSNGRKLKGRWQAGQNIELQQLKSQPSPRKKK